MNEVRIAFDCDGCLLDWNEQPDQRMIELVKFFHRYTKNSWIIVWSRRGQEWADETVNRCDIKKYVNDTGVKSDVFDVDIAFDDQHSFDMGKHNIIVRLK